jgi:6-phosphofructokinase 1
MSGLAAGAIKTYIHEEGISLDAIQSDLKDIRQRFKEDRRVGRIVIRNESSSSTYSTDILTSIFNEEGKTSFDAKAAVLGHVQQGRSPSPIDRIRATRLAVLCMQFIEKWLNTETNGVSNINHVDSACVIGVEEGEVNYTNLTQIKEKADILNRRPKHQWWLQIRHILKLLSNYECPL